MLCVLYVCTHIRDVFMFNMFSSGCKCVNACAMSEQWGQNTRLTLFPSVFPPSHPSYTPLAVFPLWTLIPLSRMMSPFPYTPKLHISDAFSLDLLPTPVFCRDISTPAFTVAASLLKSQPQPTYPGIQHCPAGGHLCDHLPK